jgi:fructokinase
MPGSLAPASGLVQNANSTWLNGRAFGKDLEAHLGRPVRLANDANCFALSEAINGSAMDARSVFGVIIGTGWAAASSGMASSSTGHAALAGNGAITRYLGRRRPSIRVRRAGADARDASRPGCPGLAWRRTTSALRASGCPLKAIAARAAEGDAVARASLDRHASRLARGIASVINIFDPDVIVLGGGLSQLTHLYPVLPALTAPYVFAEQPQVVIRPPKWGDASGVRGAARLWP